MCIWSFHIWEAQLRAFKNLIRYSKLVSTELQRQETRPKHVFLGLHYFWVTIYLTTQEFTFMTCALRSVEILLPHNSHALTYFSMLAYWSTALQNLMLQAETNSSLIRIWRWLKMDYGTNLYFGLQRTKHIKIIS